MSLKYLSVRLVSRSGHVVPVRPLVWQLEHDLANVQPAESQTKKTWLWSCYGPWWCGMIRNDWESSNWKTPDSETRMEIRCNQIQIHVPPTSTLDLPNVMWWVGVPKKALSAVSFLSRWWPTWPEMCRLCCTYGSFLMTAWPYSSRSRFTLLTILYMCSQGGLGAPTLIDGQATLALTFLHCWSKWPRHCQKNKPW